MVIWHQTCMPPKTGHEVHVNPCPAVAIPNIHTSRLTAVKLQFTYNGQEPCSVHARQNSKAPHRPAFSEYVGTECLCALRASSVLTGWLSNALPLQIIAQRSAVSTGVSQVKSVIHYRQRWCLRLQQCKHADASSTMQMFQLDVKTGSLCNICWTPCQSLTSCKSSSMGAHIGRCLWDCLLHEPWQLG